MKLGLVLLVITSISSVTALGQNNKETLGTNADVLASLPDAPSPQNSAITDVAPNATLENSGSPKTLNEAMGPIPPILTRRRLTLDDKFRIYAHQTFGPPALVFPAIGAGIRMANPPSGYPREWTDGGGAFGRLYGSAVATQTSKRTARFLTEAALHEDPRYLPATEGTNAMGRVFHALAFTVVDRNDSGGHTLAVSNYASAAAGGFVGNAYLPNGFNDNSHAGSRALSELLGLAAANLSREFAPEWAPIVRKIHIPKIVPSWWVPEHR